jgi:hypothetical protein
MGPGLYIQKVNMTKGKGIKAGGCTVSWTAIVIKTLLVTTLIVTTLLTIILTLNISDITYN